MLLPGSPAGRLRIRMIVSASALLLLLQGAAPSNDPLPIGGQATSFSLVNVMDGQSITLAEVARAHNLTVVLWIGIDCPYSNECNEDYERLHRAYKDRGVAFLGINSNDDERPPQVKAHAEEAGFTFPMLHDERNVVADAFGAGFTPELWVLDGQMKAVYHGGLIWRGNDKSMQQDFTAALDALLEGRTPPKTTTYAFGCSIKRVMPFAGDFSPVFEAESASAMHVPTLDWQAYPELRRQMERQGHVLVVNFWATWCGPCVEEFPDLMRLQKAFWDRGVRLATISMDEIGDLEEKVKPFLYGQQAVGATYFMSSDWPSDFTGTLSESWFGGIPQTLIYNPEGDLVSSLTGKRSYDEFREAVERALGREHSDR